MPQAAALQLDQAKLQTLRSKLKTVDPMKAQLLTERLWERMVKPRLDKSLTAEEFEDSRRTFTERFLELPSSGPLPSNFGERREEYGKTNRFVSSAGKGALSGLSNILDVVSGGSPIGMLAEATKGVRERGLKTLEEGQVAMRPDPAERPWSEAIGEVAGQTLPSLPIMGGTTAGLRALLPAGVRVGTATTAMGRAGARALEEGVVGAASTIPFSTEPEHITYGAAGGAVLGAAGSGIRSLVVGARGARAVAPSTAARQASAGGVEAARVTQELDDIARAAGYKDFVSVPVGPEKQALYQDWQNAQVAARNAKAAAEKQAKIASKSQTKVQTTVDRELARQNASAMQKRIAEFVRVTKRAPQADEMTRLEGGEDVYKITGQVKATKAAKKTPVAAATTQVATPSTPVATPSTTPTASPVPGSVEDMVAKAQAEVAAPAAQAPVPQATPAQIAVQKMEFKADNPQVVKAVEAVSELKNALGDVLDVPKVVPEEQIATQATGLKTTKNGVPILRVKLSPDEVAISVDKKIQLLQDRLLTQVTTAMRQINDAPLTSKQREVALKGLSEQAQSMNEAIEANAGIDGSEVMYGKFGGVRKAEPEVAAYNKKLGDAARQQKIRQSGLGGQIDTPVGTADAGDYGNTESFSTLAERVGDVKSVGLEDKIAGALDQIKALQLKIAEVHPGGEIKGEILISALQKHVKNNKLSPEEHVELLQEALEKFGGGAQ